MKRWLLAPALGLCLLLAGCSWMDGHYSSVEPYMEQGYREDQSIASVSGYQELRSALIAMVENAVESRTLSLAGFAQQHAEANLKLAIRSVMENHPVGAYAVESITYDLGSTGGVSAVVVTVNYNQNRLEIRNIRQVRNMESAQELITSALEQLQPGLVLRVSGYRVTDLNQLVQNFAKSRPDLVMEVPQVTASLYPTVGTDRVMELEFTYETSRDSLKAMQNYVRTKFSSAAMFVSGEEEPSVKFEKLYAFLMETSEYTIETSITPAYSLLRHSVGDSRAFATVYAAMCQRAGLECLTVTGTRGGEPWSWNILCQDGAWYHLDLVRCSRAGGYQILYDDQMAGYVWDYAAYPACTRPEEPKPGPGEGEDPELTEPEETQPEETQSDPTEPQQTQPQETEPEQTQPETQPQETTQPTEPEETTTEPDQVV